MTKAPSQVSRPPFVVRETFIETAFEHRFQGLLNAARLNRSWHVIAAVPGSGKSLGINDMVLNSGAYKETNGITSLPLVAIRAPKNTRQEQALGMALSASFGAVPSMAWSLRRVWLAQIMASAKTECIIIDDAQDLTLPHLAFLKELTDNLAAPPYQQQVGLCLVAASSGSIVPFKETFAGPEILWRQFRRRLDTERPFCVILGHTLEEVRDILTTFEDIYQDQLPDLQLRSWARPIFTWLTHQNLDPDATGRVTMDHLTRLIISVLRHSYEEGVTNINEEILTRTAECMILRRDDIVAIDGTSKDPFSPVQAVG